MNCFKCDKEMGRKDGGTTITGVEVEVVPHSDAKAEEGVMKINADHLQRTIAYNNRQLGKYSDGKGGCHVAICYECYIDREFGIK